jgi:hypothetical protein
MGTLSQVRIPVLLTIVFFGLAQLCRGEPRDFFDPRCPPAALVDPPGFTRSCERCVYNVIALPNNATVGDCAAACCGDWSCLSFLYSPPAPPNNVSLNGSWVNHDSLRGESGVTIVQTGAVLSALSADPSIAFWSTASGVVTSPRTLWLCFDCGGGDAKNNRTGMLSADNSTIAFERLPFDPANFTEVSA